MSLHEEFAADAPGILAEIGRPVTFRSVEWLALIGDASLSLDLQTGGFAQAGQITVKLQRSSLASSPPQDGERLTHNGTSYRIDSVTTRNPAIWFELRCSPLNA